MQTNNAGIIEAIKEVEHMSLNRWAKAQYEEHMKRVMDRKAEDAYVFEQGRTEERTKLLTLISKMSAGEDEDKVTKLDNPEVLEAMCKKYGIE